MGKALQMLAERGVSGKVVTSNDREALQLDGKIETDIGRLETALETETQAFQHPPSQGPRSRVKQAMDMAEQLIQSEQAPFAQIAVSPQEPVAPPPVKGLRSKPKTPAATSYDPKLTSLITRLMDQKRRQNMSAQMIEQMQKTLGLFVEFCEIETINDLQQMHVAQYVDMLHKLPKHNRRPPKTRHMSLKQILKTAKAGGSRRFIASGHGHLRWHPCPASA